MRFLEDPVVRLLALGVVLLGLLLVGTQYFGNRAAESEAVADARMTTEVLAHSVAEPALPPKLVTGDAGAIDRFDRAVLQRLLVARVQRIKIWDATGRIVYSDETQLIGQRFSLSADQQAVLASGHTTGDISDLRKGENRFEDSPDGLVEVYTLIHSPEGTPLLFEAYYAAGDISARAKEILRPFRTVTLGTLLLALAVAVPTVWQINRRLTTASHERERALRAAAEASDAERRRIARDLHDGVVQDLAGTAFTLAAATRDTPPGLTATLEESAAQLRSSLRDLRSLMLEIHPPALTPAGLSSALEDLLAPAAAAGLSTRLEVDPTLATADADARLVLRVAQEAVRNVLRHAEATRVDVSLQAPTNGGLVLTVNDDGRGFTPGAGRPDSFGLRGLTSLAADAGAALTVLSAPGEGTTIRLEVPRR